MTKNTQSLFAKIFIFQIILIFIVIFTEIGFRLLTTETEMGNRVETNDHTHMPRPFVMFAGKPGNDYGHNALGYKGPLPNKTKKPGEFRVFILGGSTVYNGTEYLKDSPPYSISQYLQKIANENVTKSKVVFYNFGVVSSNTMQDFVRTIVDVLDYSPDLVLFYGGANDFQNPETRAGYPHRFVFYENNPLWLSYKDYPLKESVMLSSLALRKLFYNYLSHKFSRPLENYSLEKPPEDSHMTHFRSYVDSIAKAHKILTSLGIKLVPIIQPLLDSKPYKSEDEKALHHNVCDHCFDDFFSKAMAEFEEKKIPYINASKVFDKVRRTVFVDPCHLGNGKDRQKIAAKIYEDLNRQKVLPE